MRLAKHSSTRRSSRGAPPPPRSGSATWRSSSSSARRSRPRLDLDAQTDAVLPCVGGALLHGLDEDPDVLRLLEREDGVLLHGELVAVDVREEPAAVSDQLDVEIERVRPYLQIARVHGDRILTLAFFHRLHRGDSAVERYLHRRRPHEGEVVLEQHHDSAGGGLLRRLVLLD